MAQARGALASGRKREQPNVLGQPGGASCRSGEHWPTPFRKDSLGTRGGGTKEAPDVKLEADLIIGPGQIGHRACIPTMNTGTGLVALGTRCMGTGLDECDTDMVLGEFKGSQAALIKRE